jgi:hypothetical protein
VPDVLPSWTWLSLILLGSFHGLNPAMGWLFAVARGLQERRTSAVAAALGPIAVGHALAIGVVVVAVWLLGTMLPQGALMLVGGTAMLGFAAYKVVTRFRHPAWVGMRVSGRDLVAWSFLMATAHGAGLMLVPSLLELRGDRVPAAEAHMGTHSHHMPSTAGGADDIVTSLLAVGLHTAAMFVVGGALAIVVYRKVGVDVLRRAWINVDLIWIGVLALAGTLTLGLGAWGVVAS